ncbi:MAG: GatB/YqeY domain-containing protein [Clostridia bacterium]|nr:GatB/YqeY domain-containing protein [Clostridia bacterium]MBQ3553282.1 GatB/YqeY domain-containing protein [Clostridia bacterium]
MSLKDTLMSDLKDAMKDKDVLRKNTVQMVRAAILQKEKDQQITLSDDDILEVIAKEVKTRRDSLVEFEKGGRDDLVEAVSRELEVLLGYLPKQLSEDELRAIIKETIAETGAESMRDIGKVMAAVRPKTTGRADGKQINAIAKELLS